MVDIRSPQSMADERAWYEVQATEVMQDYPDVAPEALALDLAKAEPRAWPCGGDGGGRRAPHSAERSCVQASPYLGASSRTGARTSQMGASRDVS